MKRKGYLIDKITDLNNLYLAYYKASKSKKNKKDVKNYAKNLYENLKKLQNQITTGNIEVGNYNYFTIYEPKERLICAASFAERVLHHAIINICHQYFENQLISDTYATRLNKGTYKALDKALYFSYRKKFYLKLDIRKYFDSIDHRILYQKLETIFKDPTLLFIFYQIIDSYHTQTGKGLPIGNLTSQYFANFYLSFYDSFVKHELKIKSFVRYMDDMIIWNNNSKKLTQILQKTEQFLKIELKLDLKIKYINTTKHGLNFLSYRIFDNHIELQRKSKKRFIKKINNFNNKLQQGVLTEIEYQRHILPMIAFTEHASAKGFRRKVFGY